MTSPMIAQTTITRKQLSPIIDAALANIPAVGPRAIKAAELIVTGHVSRLPDHAGRDRWIVSSQTGSQSYAVSIRGKSCDCQDAAPAAPQHNGGPLCKHRLAAMFLFKLVGDVPPTPGDQIRAILDTATTNGAETVTLFVSADYHSQDAGRVTAYRTGTSPRTEAQIEIDASFWAAVEDAGWQKSMSQSRRNGYTEMWVMVPFNVPAPAYPQAEALLMGVDRYTEDEDGMLWA